MLAVTSSKVKKLHSEGTDDFLGDFSIIIHHVCNQQQQVVVVKLIFVNKQRNTYGVTTMHIVISLD